MHTVTLSSLRLPALAALALRFVPFTAGAARAPAPALLHLRAGVIEWVERPRGLVVSCERGVLWLTLDNQPQDLILEAGRSWHCETTARLSIHALEDAQVRLGRAPSA